MVKEVNLPMTEAQKKFCVEINKRFGDDFIGTKMLDGEGDINLMAGVNGVYPDSVVTAHFVEGDDMIVVVACDKVEWNAVLDDERWVSLLQEMTHRGYACDVMSLDSGPGQDDTVH